MSAAAWPTGHPPFTARTVKATTPAWLYALLSLPADVRVLTLNTALTTLFAAPTSTLTVSARIPLPPSIYGATAHLPPLHCRVSTLSTGSLRGAVTSPGHITLVLHDDTKRELQRAYEFFLHSFPMAHVSEHMKGLFRRHFRAAVDRAGWRVGIDVLRACDAHGCADLRRLLAQFGREGGVSPRAARRGRPRKAGDVGCPVGLRELVEGVVGEVKGFFVPSLPGEKGVRVSMWRVKWRVPGGGGGKIGSPGGGTREGRAVTAGVEMDTDTTEAADSETPTTTTEEDPTTTATTPQASPHELPSASEHDSPDNGCQPDTAETKHQCV